MPAASPRIALDSALGLRGDGSEEPQLGEQ